MRIWAAAVLLLAGCSRQQTPTINATADCKTCHPAFHDKWSASRHARAMQSFSPQLAAQWSTPQPPVTIAGQAFQYRDGAIVETTTNRRYPITYAMGGKNAYYFLTPLTGGRLQVLPIGFDVSSNRWYDVAASGTRPHASGQPLGWMDPAFTFNTSCYGCHVTQLETNYNSATATYSTTFAAAGLTCQSCHGTGDPHQQRIPRSQACLPCHAKITPLRATFEPTQRFFDHYDLTTIEHPDFYADGRDLGENYTYTAFLRSGCAQSGKVDCLTCHDSAGALRSGANTDTLCTSCHAKDAGHTHHAKESAGSRCIGCHMPQTRFAAMTRTDHAFRPPTPAATMQYESPNACNICHRDQSAAWADQQARRWYGESYQAQTMRHAGWIAQARRRDWSQLPEILGYLQSQPNDVVLAASLLRLLTAVADPQVTAALETALRHPHPLVRAAAASSLAGRGSTALASAFTDEFRLVRIRAAAAAPPSAQASAAQANAIAELLAAYQARPDDFQNQTNLGNYHLRQGNVTAALPAFEAALRLRPDSVGTLVNASLAYSRANRGADAERVLREAVRIAPQSAPAQFNLGLLLAETGRKGEAEIALRAALRADPNLAPAAYNLGVLLARSNPAEAIAFCRLAVELAPQEPRYRLALAQLLESIKRR